MHFKLIIAKFIDEAEKQTKEIYNFFQPVHVDNCSVVCKYMLVYPLKIV